MHMEAREHGSACFLTLTYSQETIPLTTNGAVTLKRADLSGFLKRLRSHLKAVKLRFFAIGEYGETTHRPHYHLILFGMPSCAKSLKGSLNCSCPICSKYLTLWGKGGVWAGMSTAESISYVAQYVTKGKYGNIGSRLQDAEIMPPFSAQSTRPPLGSGMEWEIASSMLRLPSNRFDVPAAIVVNGKLMPLGNATRRRIRRKMGLSPNVPSFVADQKYFERLAITNALLTLSPSEFAAEKQKAANDAEGYRARLAWKENQRKEKL